MWHVRTAVCAEKKKKKKKNRAVDYRVRSAILERALKQEGGRGDVNSFLHRDVEELPALNGQHVYQIHPIY